MKLNKKKLGFTLIELLAVIVIIVIVLAITIPLVSNMIELVRKESFRATAYSIVDSGRFLKANTEENLGYQEFYYLDGVQYNADGKKLDYTGDGPKTGAVIITEKGKIALAIHDGTYCASKSADENKVKVSKTDPDDCTAYNIINTCDSWEEIAIKYNVNLNDLLSANEVEDPASSTCGINIKLPLTSNSSSSTASSGGSGGSKIYYKTYYSVGYATYSETFPKTSYNYTIQLGVLPISIDQIKAIKVVSHSIFEGDEEFKRYIVKKNMGEVIWPGNENPPEVDISQATVFNSHALRPTNMTSDEVIIECDTTKCYANLNMTINDMNNLIPNTVEEKQIGYLPIKFTVEFNGEGDSCIIKPANDGTPGILAGSGTIASPYLVESIEDLVVLSNNVNSGNSFSGQYISIVNSLDFKNQRTYADYQTTAYGDINGNTVVEDLYTELTTGAGFVPIGNNVNQFKGKLIGQTGCIYNLYINRPSTAYVGLFGYNNGGSINTLTLNKVNVTGASNVGGLVGYNNGTVADVTVIGNVAGTDNVGLAVGYSNYNAVTSVITNGKVSGANNVGGVIGYATHTTVRAINKGGSITASGTGAGRIIGGNDASGISSLALSSVTVNGATVTSTTPTSTHGTDFTNLRDLNNLNLVELALDTYIGGDNDANGYYWDYDVNGNVVRKSIGRFPLTFTLSGAGTAADPYLVGNYDDLKQVTLKQTSTFKMTSNIDLKGKKFYMLGSYINPFKGKLDGNGMTISNLTLKVPGGSYVAFIGSNSGTINSVTLDKINVTSGNYTGALTGYNSGNLDNIIIKNANVIGSNYTALLAGYNQNGNIYDSNLKGNVTGGNYTALVTGYFYASGAQHISSVIANGNVTGGNYVSGMVGFAYYAGVATDSVCSVRAIYTGGNIISTGGSVARIVAGYGREYAARPYVAISALAMSSVTVNGTTITSTYPTTTNGANISNMDELNNINLAETSLDTYIGGDNDGNGYYWDYDNVGAIVRKSVISDPLTFSLAGSGTTTDPYLISNYTDLKQATLRLSSHYRITADIDLSGERFYMLGSYINPFRGSIDGNSKTISNANVDTMRGSYIGFSGYNRGIIRDLNLTNVDISGANYVGGLVGYIADGQVFNSNITGDVMGTDYVGLITGYFYASGTHQITSVTTQGNVIGVNNVGGMVGFAYYAGVPTDSVCAVRGINKGGMIIATGGSIGRIVGGYGREYAARPYVAISALALSSVTINGSTIASTSPTSTHGANITSMNDLNNINLAETALDTYIGGDNDGDGYYWDYDASYNVVRKKVSEYPLTFNLTGSGTTVDPYLIGSYDELKQASLKLGSAYKLTSNIDMTDKKHYMIGSQVNNFTGRFDGNAMTINNLTINNPYGSYVGLIGYNRGTVMGLNLTNIDIDASDFVGGLAGYSVNSQITNSKITGNVSGNNYVALVTGYFYTSGLNEISSVIVEGNVSGNSRIAGVAGHLQNGNGAIEVAGAVKTIYTGGSITGTSSVGRIAASYGRDYAARPYITINSSAVSSIPLNGATVTSTSSSSIHGLDITAADLSNTVTYTDRGFNFTDETLDYIWYIDNGTATFRAGSM